MSDAEQPIDDEPAEDTPTEEPPVFGLFTNGRLRHQPREGEPGVIEMGELELRRRAWVGGRLYVDADEIRFAGLEMMPYERLGRWKFRRFDYAVAMPADGIETVERRRGIVGVPYVAVTATDGAELQLRCGPFGSKSDLVVETIQALIDG